MLLFSYPLSKTTPFYGNSQSVSIRPSRSITAGDTANTSHLEFSNHSGTHIDAPYHFDEDGKKITDYTLDFWRCQKVLCIESPSLPEAKEQLGILQFEDALEFVTEGFKKTYEQENSALEIEAILWKTGWCQRRGEDAYATAGPGIAAELAEYLREKFPNLRFLGFDLISLSSFANREAGREAHRAFLCHERPILPIEDMDLRNLPKKYDALQNLLISPLFIQEGDGAPVTVWAEI